MGYDKRIFTKLYVCKIELTHLWDKHLHNTRFLISISYKNLNANNIFYKKM